MSNKPKFLKIETSYLEWAGNKITELNAEVRELKVRRFTDQTECPCCSAELNVSWAGEKIISVISESCIHTWIPFVSDKIYLQCSKCGVVKLDE